MVLKVIKKIARSTYCKNTSFIVVMMTMVGCHSNDQSNWTEQRLGGERISDLVRNSGEEEQDSLSARLEFEETRISFDTISEGSVVNHSYRFLNTGHAPLLIASVKSSCGCTVPKWPKEVISVGEGGIVEIEFDSENRSGKISKSVKINANTIPRETTLHFTVFVKPHASSE